jgi:hypothetical protein
MIRSVEELRRKRTADIGSCREESSFAGDHGECGIRVVVEFAERSNGVGDEVTSEGVELFRAIELFSNSSCQPYDSSFSMRSASFGDLLVTNC